MNGGEASTGGSVGRVAIKASHSEEGQHFSFRWGIPLLDAGHTMIPNFFFDCYQKAGIEREEFLVVLHLARYQFEQEGSVCRPSIPTIARQLGYSVRHLRRMLADLEGRNLLIRSFRPGRPTVYNFSGFSQAILEAAGATSKGKMTPDTHVLPTPDIHVRGPRTPTSHEEEKKKEQTKNGGGALSEKLTLLTNFGVSRSVARALAAACEIDQVRGWIAYAERAQGLRDPVALVVARLKAGEQPPTPPRSVNLANRIVEYWERRRREFNAAQ